MAGTRWVRNRQGSVIHRFECPRIKGKGIPWQWPENNGITTGERLQLALEGTGAHGPRWNEPCSVCDPFSVIPGDQFTDAEMAELRHVFRSGK